MSFILDEKPQFKKQKNPLLVLLLIGFVLSFLMGLGIFYYTFQTEEASPLAPKQIQLLEESVNTN